MDDMFNYTHSLFFDATCIYSQKLLEQLEKINQKFNNTIDIEAIKDVITFTRRYHARQMRKSGEPFYSHPLEVASLVASYLPKTEIITTAILHDVVEDTQISSYMIE